MFHIKALSNYGHSKSKLYTQEKFSFAVSSPNSLVNLNAQDSFILQKVNSNEIFKHDDIESLSIDRDNNRKGR